MDEMMETAGTALPEAEETATSPSETEAPSAPETPPQDGGLTVKFNKQLRTLSRDEATNYAQKGLKYDAVEPLLNELREMAGREGQTLNDWVAAQRAQPPTEDEVLVRRLAAEYTALRREIPDVGAFDTLPPEAVRAAAEEGLSLLDAYLRHEHRERRKCAEAQAQQAAAAAAATGSQASGAGEGTSPTVAALLSGIWGRE